MKEHKKLYKAGKNWLVATIAVAALGVVAGQQNVHAATGSTDQAVTNINDETQAAQQAVNVQQNKVNDAQAKVNQAQKTVNQANQDNQNAQTAVQTAKDGLANATKEQQAGGHTQAEIDTLTQTVKNDQQKQEAAQQAVNAANADVKAKTDAQTDAQRALDTLQQQVDSHAQFSLPTFDFTADQKSTTQAYVKAVNRILNSGRSWSSNEFTQVPEFAAWERAMTTNQKVDWTDNLAADQDEQINLNAMTNAQVQDLSSFTAAVMNELRNELGISSLTGKAVVSNGMVSEAKEVSDLYNQDQSLEFGHYIYALKKAAFDHGMTAQDATNEDKQFVDSNDFGESLNEAWGTGYTNVMSMAAAKEAIVQAIAGMLFDDTGSNMGHASAVIGAYDNGGNDYLGTSLSFSKYQGYGAHLIHFLQFSNTDFSNARSSAEQSKQAAQQMKVEIANPYENSGSSAQDPALQSKLASAKSKLADAKTALAKSKAAATDAQQQLETAKDELSKDNNALHQMQGTKTEDQLNKAVELAKANLQTAQQKAEQTGKALQDAQSKLTAAQTELATAKQALKDAQDKLTSLNKGSQSSASKPSSSSASSASSSASKPSSSSASSASSSASKPSSSSASSAGSSASKPSSSSASSASSSASKPSSSAASSASSSASKPSSSAASSAGSSASKPSSSAAIIDHSADHSAAKAASSEMNDKAAKAAVTANKPSAASQMAKVAAKKTNKDHAKLPQTGNHDSVAAMAMGAVLAMFGLGVGMKKRQD